MSLLDGNAARGQELALLGDPTRLDRSAQPGRTSSFSLSLVRLCAHRSLEVLKDRLRFAEDPLLRDHAGSSKAEETAQALGVRRGDPNEQASMPVPVFYFFAAPVVGTGCQVGVPSSQRLSVSAR